MTSKFKTTAILAAILLNGTAAIAADQEILMYHTWSSPTELKAIDFLEKTYQEKTGNTIRQMSFAMSGGAADGLQNMIAGGNPPAAFMYGTPSTYVDLQEQGLAVDLTSYLDSTDLWEHAFPIVRELSTVNGQIPMIPLELVTDGVLYYNMNVAKEAGVDPTKWASMDDMFADFDAIRDKGFIPIAIGADRFQISWLFHTLLAAEAGPEIYNKIFSANVDQAAIDTPEMRKVLDRMRQLQQAQDEGAPNRKWNDTTNLVITGKALMQIHGDWMKGEFRTAGLEIGTDYGCMNVPGAKAVVVANDVLGLINKGQNPGLLEAQEQLTSVIIDPAFQGEFTQIKGATPIRGDVDPKFIDACTQFEIDNLQRENFAVARPMNTTDPDWFEAVYDVADGFWNNPDMTNDEAIAEMQDAYETIVNF